MILTIQRINNEWAVLYQGQVYKMFQNKTDAINFLKKELKF